MMGGPGSGRKVGCSQPCGTRTKYNWHRSKGENCELCKKAAANFYRQKYIKKPKPPRALRKYNARQWLMQMKVDRVRCSDCGLRVTHENTYVFDFDHRDPKCKSFTIGSAAGYSKEILYQEMLKCDLVCSNCHRHRTFGQRKNGILTGFSQQNFVETPQLFTFEEAS
jgi:hypothetical protein